MFEHEKFDHYAFEEVPLDRDVLVMSEKWMGPYEKAMVQFFNGGGDGNVGYVSFVSIDSVSQDAMQISWIVNMGDRYHQIPVTLPRSAFVVCVGSWRYDEKPHLFVKNSWLDHLHLSNYSVFGMIDAIGVRKALEMGQIDSAHLIALRERIDSVAERYPKISFISFGDSLMVKSNWTVGMFDSEVSYTYEPEQMLHLIRELGAAYRDVLGLAVYGILTQGANDYYGSALLHTSSSGNHVCLNSLGVPFERLQSIDNAARKAIREGVHPPASLYLEEEFLWSIRLAFEFKRRERMPSFDCRSKMRAKPSRYYITSCDEILENLRRPQQ